MGEVNMDESEIRKSVKNDVEADAITVEQDDGVTTIQLFYHEPESQVKPIRTPFGRFAAVLQPDTDKMLEELVREIFSYTSPDNVNVEDKNGFYEVTLTYEDDKSW